MKRKPITLPPLTKPRKKRASPNYSPEERERRRQLLRQMNADSAFTAKRMTGFLKARAQIINDPVRRQKQLAHMRKMNERSRAATRLSNYKRYEDPAERKKASEIMKQNRKDPVFNAKRRAAGFTAKGRHGISAAVKRTWNKRRGFKVPASLRQDYRLLTQTKRYSAAEAGKILGLI